MEWVVTAGRSVEEAIDTALDRLGVDEQDAEIEILREAQKGLFGRIRVEAQVRVRVRPARPRPKVERRDRRRSDRRGAGRGGERRVSAKANDAESSRRSDEAGEAGNGAAGQPAGTTAGPGPTNPGPSGDGARRRRRRRRSNSGGGQQGVAVETNDSPAASALEPVTDVEPQRDAVANFLRELLVAFGRADASLTVTTADNDRIEANIDGEELGILVGQKGVTLQALHELVRSMLQRRFVGMTHARVRLDVAGYRERRRAALERFVRQVAEGVRLSGVAKVLDPMAPPDRKIVHDVVNDIDGLSTTSEGEEPARRVVIRPAD